MLTKKLKTDVRMLPQFGPREGQAVDNPSAAVAIRAAKASIQTADGAVQGIHAKHCELLAGSDGYGYALTRKLRSSPGLTPRVSRSLI